MDFEKSLADAECIAKLMCEEVKEMDEDALFATLGLAFDMYRGKMGIDAEEMASTLEKLAESIRFVEGLMPLSENPVA